MTAVLESLRQWIEQIILDLRYPGIALIMLVENLFPPILPSSCCPSPASWSPEAG